MAKEDQPSERVVAQNRRARHDYTILETVEAGLVLTGTEVKSLRAGKASLAEAYATVAGGEAVVRQLHIPPYEQGNRWNLEPTRRRKLLLHRSVIRKLIGKTVEKGMTLVPIRMYFKDGRVKIAVSIAKGKKDYDKRETIKKRETDRETRAAVKSHGR